ncbi:phospholipase D family protein [Chryseobacterium bernardetii]|uniref:phospholipase D family protein n=1 Tax=Chryseobacterium bernardetii TaxID=1241978 RepID=UPI003AF48E7B
MDLILKNTDVLNTGFFVLNKNKIDYNPFLAYKSIFLTQENNVALKNEILDIIQKATSVLKICSFIITDKEIFTAVLNKAKETQVAIFILTQLDSTKLENSLSLVDFITEEEIKENPARIHLKYIKQFYDNGIHVRASLSAHSKFIVSDRTTGFIMSANFTTPSLTFNTESGVYLDEKSSKELDKLFDIIFLQGTTYKQFLGTHKKDKMLVVQSEVNIDSNLLPKPENSNLRYTCENFSDNLLNEIITIIDDSHQYLYLSTYSIVELNSLKQITQSIKKAVDRGVSVSIFCRGMNYRNDHLKGVSELFKIGCKIYGDVFNHSKGIINENKAMLFTANIDGNHGLTDGFEVGYLLNETQRIEFLNLHKKLIETSFYIFDNAISRNDLFITYNAYEQQKGMNIPSLPKYPIISYRPNVIVEVEELESSIIFYGKSKDCEYLIAGNSFYKCIIKGDNIFILEKTTRRFDIEKYILKFYELKIIIN